MVFLWFVKITRHVARVREEFPRQRMRAWKWVVRRVGEREHMLLGIARQTRPTEIAYPRA